MKTKNNKAERYSRVITLALVMLALTTISFGQVVKHKNPLLNTIKERVLHRGGQGDIFRTVNYYENGGNYSTTNISRTIHTGSVEIIYDDQLKVENWMTTPFDVELDEAVKVEGWMSAPFEIINEEPVNVESWMTVPFETTGETKLEVEGWMTRPFESALEDELVLEDWMTKPFNGTGEDVLAVEDWMTKPFELQDPAYANYDIRTLSFLAVAL